MTRQPASAVGQVSLLILAVIVVVEFISFALVLWMPAPEQPRYSIRAVAQALAKPGGHRPADFSLRLASAPDDGTSAVIIEQALTLLLNEEPRNIRAIWRAADGGGAPLTIIDGNGRRGAPPNVLVTLSTLPLPAFSAARRMPDGHWLVARADRSNIAAWQIRMLLAFVLSAAVLVPVAILAARRLTVPLRRLEDVARDDGRDRPSPGRSTGPREIRAASDAIVRMRDRLAERARERVRVLAAVAHDLRTPLTGLRLRIEDMEEPDRTRIIDDIDRMERMIADMLAHARDDYARSSPVQIDVDAVIARIVTLFPSDRVQVAPKEETGGNLWIDPQDFERAIGNLVHNAITYGQIATIDVVPTPSQVTVTVHDCGPGISSDQRMRVLRPFERGEGSRSRHTGGVGLGLSSAQDIARRYGGDIEFREQPPKGFTVAISFRRDQRSRP